MIQFSGRKLAYTMNYSQPDEYHFCLDSVLLAHFAAHDHPIRVGVHRSEFHALDLCAGCGVVGLEYSFSEPSVTHIDFVERQAEFSEHLARNFIRAQVALEALDSNRAPIRFRKLAIDFRELGREAGSAHEGLQRAIAHSQRYDLILANPPYFFANEGVMSRSTLQNHCRFFLEGSLIDFVSAVERSLKPEGCAYFLLKSGREHGANRLHDLALHLSVKGSGLKLEKIYDIRGTDVVLASHSS